MFNKIINESCLTGLSKLPEKSVQCCVTSPPYYGLRDYGHADQLGLEETPEQYVENIVQVFREVRRVLADDGTLWLNLGDSYAARQKNRTGPQANKKSTLTSAKTQSQALVQPNKVVSGLKEKDLIGIPWRVAFALQADGWYLRQDIIWHKPNPMPESVTDRCTKAHEYIFLLSKSNKYYFDNEAISEPAKYGPNGSTFDTGKTFEHHTNLHRTSKKRGEFNGKTNELNGSEAFIAITETRNKRSVWTVPTKPYSGAHFAVFPDSLITPCIQAGSKEGDLILDPFFGSGTTGEVALRLNRKFVGFEINQEYITLAEKRLEPHLNNLFSV